MKIPKPSRALEAEYQADMAMLDELIAECVAPKTAALPDPPKRVFSETWVDENGVLRYDFEVYGTGLSVREWDAKHGKI